MPETAVKPMAGKDGELKIGTERIAYIDTWSLTLNQGTTECSQIGNREKEFMATVFDFSGSLSGTFVYDAKQKSLVDNILNGSDDEIEAVFKAGRNLTLSGKIIPNSASFNAAHGDKVSISFNFQGTGNLTSGTPA